MRDDPASVYESVAMISFLRRLLTRGSGPQSKQTSSAPQSKKFKLRADQIKPIAPGHGACIASDMITVHGKKVGFMYREEPRDEVDSGWCFNRGDRIAGVHGRPRESCGLRRKHDREL